MSEKARKYPRGTGLDTDPPKALNKHQYCELKADVQ
jgi:hypothetical protein